MGTDKGAHAPEFGMSEASRTVGREVNLQQTGWVLGEIGKEE